MAAGVIVFEALKAYEELRAAGIAVRIIDLYSVAPSMSTPYGNPPRPRTNRVLTVEDHYLHGRISDAVLSALAVDGVRLTKMVISQILDSGKSINYSIIMD